MKKRSVVALAAGTIVGIGLMAGSALASPVTFTVDDTEGKTSGGWNNWNNVDSLNTTLQNADEHGTPTVESLKVDYDATSRLLTKVRIILGANDRQTFDSLFINTSYTATSTWDTWDHYIIDGLDNNNNENKNHTGTFATEDGMYEVNDTYSYTTSTDSSARTNNPDGIDKNSLGTWTDFTVDYGKIDGDWTITYDFGTGLSLGGGGFFIAYSPWCSNDVVGGGVQMDPVPEPSTMLLFGAGLAGLAGVARRRKMKK